MTKTLPPLPNGILTIEAAAESLGVSRVTVWRYVKDGRLPAPRAWMGRKVFWRADVDTFKRVQEKA
jgi:excisionase family DNA binding protein